MKQSLLTTLRDARTDTAAFRRAAHGVARLLAAEAVTHCAERTAPIETPVAPTIGYYPERQITLVPVLRAGLALLPTFMECFENARVGFAGFRRDEETAESKEYYRNLPPFSAEDQIIVLDPMLATGGSALATIEAVITAGGHAKQIIAVFVVAAPEGLQRLKERFPEVTIISAAYDEKLNDKKYIVPGLGDFGDRYFGTM